MHLQQSAGVAMNLKPILLSFSFRSIVRLDMVLFCVCVCFGDSFPSCSLITFAHIFLVRDTEMVKTYENRFHISKTGFFVFRCSFGWAGLLESQCHSDNLFEWQQTINCDAKGNQFQHFLWCLPLIIININWQYQFKYEKKRWTVSMRI